MSLQPPVLPPIPRVASRHESEVSSARKEQAARPAQKEEGRHTGALSQETRGNAAGPASGVSPSHAAPEAPALSPVNIPTLSTSEDAEISFDQPRMEATMFPSRQPQQPNDPFTAGPPMTRSFIDSRDRPYSHNVQRPPAVASSYSSPDVIPPRSATAQGLRPPGPSSSSRPNATSGSSLEDVRKTSSATGTNYSGSTARPSIQSSKSASASPLSQTIGTPYSETSASFPAPQHVATRPKTMGSSSTIAGVMVPTHHSNSGSKDVGKPEKRKTRLLNPMALLVRRKSGQEPAHVPDEAARRAHAQAQVRQKSVATAGINTIPEDFDPRIRGKIVHDFNAPRARRAVSSSGSDFGGNAGQQLPSTDSMPIMSSVHDQHRPSMNSTHRSDVSSRHSRHTPIFVEHLYDEPSNDGQAHPIQAERLENKDFLKRASHQSSPSQESSILPPFARRSQQMDPMQASFFRDDNSSKRSSDQSNLMNRESTASSGAGVSPIAARMSSSPTTQEAPDRNRRPISDMSMLGGRFDVSSSDQTTSAHMQQPSVSTIDENASPAQRSPNHHSNSPPDLKAIHPALRNLISGPNSPKPIFPDPTSARSSPAIGSSVPSTPEPVVADAAVAFQSPSTPPRLVEKLPSAVGHSKTASLTPKHAASNASRFSFQLDASAAEEKALEEKHRRVAAAQPARKKSMREADDDDEDDYFDEDAMDDEDEMEADMRRHDNMEGSVNGTNLGDGVARFQHQPRDQIPQSDTSSVYDDDVAVRKNRELTYAEHPAFRGHSAVYSSKHTSMAPSSHYSSDMSTYGRDGWTSQHQRITSDATIMTLADSENNFNGQAGPSSGFYMQPQAAGYGMGLGADLGGGRGVNRDSTMTVSTVQSNGGPSQPGMNVSASGNQPSPRFSGFRFIDSPERSRPPTSDDPRQSSTMATGRDSVSSPINLPQAPVTSPIVHPSANSNSYAYGTTNESESAAYHGSIGKNIRARNVSMNQNLQYAASETDTESGQDDMYFDDGGFGEDVQNSSGYGESINEDELDNPDFAGGFKGMEPRGYHERHTSAMTITSRDGPYPTFAMPNAGKAQLRQSQMLLDDLPLQDAGNGQWVPQRNPSDDAKRLGLSDQVPPLPAQSGSQGGSSQMAAYHQALADAANRAADDGRFERDPSISTARSSVYSLKDEEGGPNRDSGSVDDKSRYSRETDATTSNVAAGTLDLPKFGADFNAAAFQEVTAARYMNNGVIYTPPRMSGFDFGFNASPSNHSNAAPGDDYAPFAEDNAPTTDEFNPNDFDDSYNDEDDDFIAAANAEALAYDDSGFYGQEFGFYARARSNSTGSAKGEQPMEAVNGGYFGEDGDDPLRRQKSGREPDLTPITERSEFSARNSFINFGPASASWGHPGVASPALARLPLSPLVSGADGPNKQRASGGGYFGVFPPAGPTSQSHQPFVGASPASTTNSPARPWTTSDSPVSATSTSSRGVPFTSTSASASALGVNMNNSAADPDATPRKPQISSPLSEAPGTAKKVPLPAVNTSSNGGHSRNHSGADSVTYVRETVSPGEENGGPPRWVLERRRTSELGIESVVGREVVKDGWI